MEVRLYVHHKGRNILTDFQFLYGRCKTSPTLGTDTREEGRGGLVGTFLCHVRSYNVNEVRLILMPN